LRRLLVPAVAIPVAGGAIAVAAVREAAVEGPFAFAASTVAMALAGASVVWVNAARLHSIDLRRTSAEDAVASERRTGGVLRLLRSIAMAANDSDVLEEVAAFCLGELCRFTGWAAGNLWLLDDAGERLAPSGAGYVVPGEGSTPLRRVTGLSPSGSGPRRGEGLPGRVWDTGQPGWIEDAARDPGLLRPGAQKDLGVRGAFAFPVVSSGEVVAVLELFSAQPQARDEDLLTLMVDVGRILSRLVDRARAAELLREGEERIRRVIETAGDAFVSLSARGRVSGWNRRAEAMFGWSAEEAAGRPLGSLILPARLSAGSDGDGLPAGVLAPPRQRERPAPGADRSRPDGARVPDRADVVGTARGLRLVDQGIHP
jgi:PAS domain-containing protein